MAPWHKLQPSSGLRGGYVDNEVFVIWSLDYFKQTGNPEMFIGCIWGKEIVRCEGGRVDALRSLLKSELELMFSTQMSPLWSLYHHPFHKNHIYPPGHNLQAYVQALGGCVGTGVLLSVLWIIFNKMAISKFVSIVFGGKRAWWVSCPPITFDS